MTKLVETLLDENAQEGVISKSTQDDSRRLIEDDSTTYEICNYIDGDFTGAAQDFAVTNPYSESIIARAPRSGPDEAELALKAAQKAFPMWSQSSVDVRSRFLEKIADLILEHGDELARIESQDNGKPYWLAREREIPRAAENFRFFAHAITSFHSEAFDMSALGFNYTRREPLGAVVCISPWNLPLYLLSWKIAPALAAGNCVVAKPSELTPASAYLLAKICQKAQLPKGVLNIVHGLGSEVGESLVKHPLTRAVSFTGGTVTGKKIAQWTAEKMIPSSLELGGKNAALVFGDCDIDSTCEELVRASFTNSGQICLCSSRILVHRSIYETFKEKFVSRAKALTLGDPFDSHTKMGPLVSQSHLAKVKSYIDLAQRDQGNILLDGRNPAKLPKHGFFLGPTIIEGLPSSHCLHQEEIFGPVVCLASFDSFDQAVAMANDSPYGLSATVWTQSLDLAHQAARALHVGIVWINAWMMRDLRTPFGGTKASGMGREGGVEALRFFTESKNICLKYGVPHA